MGLLGTGRGKLSWEEQTAPVFSLAGCVACAVTAPARPASNERLHLNTDGGPACGLGLSGSEDSGDGGGRREHLGASWERRSTGPRPAHWIGARGGPRCPFNTLRWQVISGGTSPDGTLSPAPHWPAREGTRHWGGRRGGHQRLEQSPRPPSAEADPRGRFCLRNFLSWPFLSFHDSSSSTEAPHWLPVPTEPPKVGVAVPDPPGPLALLQASRLGPGDPLHTCSPPPSSSLPFGSGSQPRGILSARRDLSRKVSPSFTGEAPVVRGTFFCLPSPT